MEQIISEDPQDDGNALGHFDEFGQFKWNYVQKEKRKRAHHIELKDLSEKNFLDLIEAKN